MPQNRVCAATVRHKNQLFFFCGCKSVNSALITDYWEDALSLDLISGKWKVIKYSVDDGLGKIAPRPSRYSSAAKFKEKAALIGGQTHEGDLIEDFWIFYFGNVILSRQIHLDEATA